MGFTQEELQIIKEIRDLNNDQEIDEYDALETYYEIMGE